MSKKLDLKEAFRTYFHEREGFALRSERFYQDISDCRSKADLAKVMAKWLQAAFDAGAKALADDTLAALGDFGTAVAGIDQPKRNPTECFDASGENLKNYFDEIFAESNGPQNAIPKV